MLSENYLAFDVLFIQTAQYFNTILIKKINLSQQKVQNCNENYLFLVVILKNLLKCFFISFFHPLRYN